MRQLHRLLERNSRGVHANSMMCLSDETYQYPDTKDLEVCYYGISRLPKG